jgi:DnaJ-domain-containing protein 1
MCKSPYWDRPKVRPATRGLAKVIERDIQAALEQSRRWRHKGSVGAETLAELSDALASLRVKVERKSQELERKLERCLTET